jgi:hypothetical protein
MVTKHVKICTGVWYETYQKCTFYKVFKNQLHSKNTYMLDTARDSMIRYIKQDTIPTIVLFLSISKLMLYLHVYHLIHVN